MSNLNATSGSSNESGNGSYPGFQETFSFNIKEEPNNSSLMVKFTVNFILKIILISLNIFFFYKRTAAMTKTASSFVENNNKKARASLFSHFMQKKVSKTASNLKQQVIFWITRHSAQR